MKANKKIYEPTDKFLNKIDKLRDDILNGKTDFNNNLSYNDDMKSVEAKCNVLMTINENNEKYSILFNDLVNFLSKATISNSLNNKQKLELRLLPIEKLSSEQFLQLNQKVELQVDKYVKNNYKDITLPFINNVSTFNIEQKLLNQKIIDTDLNKG